MNTLLLLVAGALLLGALPALSPRRLTPLAFGLAVAVTLLFFFSSRGR
jgi:hypothetical protein